MSTSYLPPDAILDLALKESSDGPPDPPALNRTTGLYPFNEDGASSQMFRCIVKRPHADQPVSFSSRTTEPNDLPGELSVQPQPLDDIVKQFAAELRVFRTIGIHKNVVRFFGVIEKVGIVLEEIDHGHTLLDLLPTVWKDATKIDWFNQILEGLAHIHKFGLSHGDLSCTNVSTIPIYPMRLLTASTVDYDPVQRCENSRLWSQHIHRRGGHHGNTSILRTRDPPFRQGDRRSARRRILLGNRSHLS